MFFNPAELVLMIVLVVVTGYVAKNLMISWHRLQNDERPKSDRLGMIEERLRKIETATSSLLVDVSGLREKQRFMSQLQTRPREAPATAATHDNDISPMVTQNIPIVSRLGSPRQ